MNARNCPWQGVNFTLLLDFLVSGSVGTEPAAGAFTAFGAGERFRGH
jgi:hypothetical protein